MSHASSVYTHTHTYTPLMLCQLGCFFYAILLLMIYEWYVCKQHAADWEELLPILRLLMLSNISFATCSPSVALCKPLTFVKVKLCDGICLGGCGVSGMLAHYVKSHGWWCKKKKRKKERKRKESNSEDFNELKKFRKNELSVCVFHYLLCVVLSNMFSTQCTTLTLM